MRYICVTQPDRVTTKVQRLQASVGSQERGEERGSCDKAKDRTHRSSNALHGLSYPSKINHRTFPSGDYMAIGCMTHHTSPLVCRGLMIKRTVTIKAKVRVLPRIPPCGIGATS